VGGRPAAEEPQRLVRRRTGLSAERDQDKPGSAGIELTLDQLERLNQLTPAAGERHNEESMASIDR